MIILELFLTFFKIGAFTFGGGYAMLPLVQDEVLRHGWLDEETLVNFIAVSESTPGPFAINIATYVGKLTGGLPGALASTAGVVLPSFVIILIVSHFVKKFRESKPVAGALTGLKAAVPGLVAAALVTMAGAVLLPAGGVSALGSPSFYISLGIFALCAVLVFVKVTPILLILLSAALGIGAGFAFGL